MGIELPEAHILSTQMDKELRGKQIKIYQLKNYQKLQKIGFINRDISAFNLITNSRVESIVSRGNVIRMKLCNGMNLILGPEYGGRILFHNNENTVPEKFHLCLYFTDDTMLSVTLTGMGAIQALKDSELENSYVYKRDFSSVASPLDDQEFGFERFSEKLASKNTNIKSVLVGKDAVVVGLSNSAYQDIIYRAKIHPKRKASNLSENETHALYNAIKLVIRERIKLGGKDQFVDLYGKQGCYAPAMGPNMKGQTCASCGTRIEKLSIGGGQIYLCSKCQI
jgi:formamidopyrimidine-DNA glycosylase